MEENKSDDSGIDKSQFYDLFKEIQNEIKDKVITKYLHLIENQAKELDELRKENTLLKNQLTYILKRILLNKNDYTSAARTNRLNNLNSSIDYNRSMILKDNNRKSNSMLRPLRSCENYRCVTENIASRYKENNNSTTNLLGNDNNNINVDNKVSGYLNSLYRHNFNNSNKAGGNYFLNKNKGLLEELFPSKNNYYIDNEQTGNDGTKNKGNKKNEEEEKKDTLEDLSESNRNSKRHKKGHLKKKKKDKFLESIENTLIALDQIKKHSKKKSKRNKPLYNELMYHHRNPNDISNPNIKNENENYNKKEIIK